MNSVMWCFTVVTLNLIVGTYSVLLYEIWLKKLQCKFQGSFFNIYLTDCSITE